MAQAPLGWAARNRGQQGLCQEEPTSEGALASKAALSEELAGWQHLQGLGARGGGPRGGPRQSLARRREGLEGQGQGHVGMCGEAW